MSERTIKTRIAQVTGIIRGLQHLGAGPMPVAIRSKNSVPVENSDTDCYGSGTNRLGVFNDNHYELSDDDYPHPKVRSLALKGT